MSGPKANFLLAAKIELWMLLQKRDKLDAGI